MKKMQGANAFESRIFGSVGISSLFLRTAIMPKQLMKAASLVLITLKPQFSIIFFPK